MKSILPAAAALLVCLPALHPQEKVKLAIRENKGDKYTLESTKSLEGKILITVDGQETCQDLRHLEAMNYACEILDIGPDLRSERRKYDEWTKSALNPGATEPARMRKVLSGKTIVIKRVGGKTQFEGAEEVPADELEEAKPEKGLLAATLPADPVEAGTTWTIDDLNKYPGIPKNILVDLSTFKAKGTFEKVEEVQGVRCALISFRVSGKGRLQGCDGAQVDFQAQGSQWLTLDTGRILKTSMGGTFDISGELQQNGRTIKWGGRMVAKGEAVRKYE